MTGLPGDDPATDTRARLLLERDRVCDRLRSMSLARISAPMGDDRTRAGAAMACARTLADLVQAVELEPDEEPAEHHPGGRPAAGAPGAPLAGQPWSRLVPDLPAHAVGDAVAVMVNDLDIALQSAPGPRQADFRSRAVRELVALRLLL